MIENPNLYSEKRYRIDIIVFISTINSNEVSGGLSNIFKVLLKHYLLYLAQFGGDLRSAEDGDSHKLLGISDM